MTWIDWIVFCLILFLTVAVVVYGQYRKKVIEKVEGEQENLLDLLIMGRRLTLPLFVATLVATWYGGIFGVTQISFEHGIYNFVTQGLFWYVAYFIFAFFIVDKVAAYQAVTLPDLVSKLFGPRSGKVAGLFNFFNVLPIAYTMSLGFFWQTLFGGPLWIGMCVGVLVVLLYSAMGGIRAVIYSDLIQFVVMCLSVFLVIAFSVVSLGGWNYLTQNLPETHFHFTGGQGLGTTLVWGFIALSTLVDPNFYQRCFAATNVRVAKKGILLSIFVWFLFDICTTLGGMYARAALPEASSSTAYLTYALQLLPPGLRGFFLAGILATILSTLDSYLFLAGTTISYDLLPQRMRHRINLHHINTVLVGLLSVGMALLFDGSIKKVWKTLGSYSAACLLFPVLFAYFFPKKLTDNQFIIACTVGVLGTTYWKWVEHRGFWQQVDELYVGLLCTSSVILTSVMFNRLKKSFG